MWQFSLVFFFFFLYIGDAADYRRKFCVENRFKRFSFLRDNFLRNFWNRIFFLIRWYALLFMLFVKDALCDCLYVGVIMSVQNLDFFFIKTLTKITQAPADNIIIVLYIFIVYVIKRKLEFF